MAHLKRFTHRLSFIMTAGLAACQMGGQVSASSESQPTEPVIARLPDTSPETLDLVRDRLAAALGIARIEFGAGDLAETSILTVLPPPLGSLDTRSPAKPEAFDIRMDDQSCFLVRRSTRERIDLTGLACTPIV